jgi:hypothetical protein
MKYTHSLDDFFLCNFFDIHGKEIFSTPPFLVTPVTLSGISGLGMKYTHSLDDFFLCNFFDIHGKEIFSTPLSWSPPSGCEVTPRGVVIVDDRNKTQLSI